MLPTTSRTEAGIPRRRAIAACLKCRKQKVKCSGQRPQCRRCLLRRETCIYEIRESQQPYGGQEPQDPGLLVLAEASRFGFEEEMAVTDEHASPYYRQDSLKTMQETQLLARDVVGRHIDAYFHYIHHLPGYDFFHRPSLMEEFLHNKLDPVLCKAICAAVSMYIASSSEARQLSMQWAKDVDAYIFSNLHKLTRLQLQLMVLSMFQNIAYRQFGRVWQMHGMAGRLAISLQLNAENASQTDSQSVACQEGTRRLIWGLYLHDKVHAGGIEEFVALPSRWMTIALPMTESNFEHEIETRMVKLSDVRSGGGSAASCPGSNAYLVILHELRHRVLQ